MKLTMEADTGCCPGALGCCSPLIKVPNNGGGTNNVGLGTVSRYVFARCIAVRDRAPIFELNAVPNFTRHSLLLVAFWLQRDPILPCEAYGQSLSSSCYVSTAAIG